MRSGLSNIRVGEMTSWLHNRGCCWRSLVLVTIALLMLHCNHEVEAKRTFEVDWANDRFLKDGEPFRFIAGSFHYFRAHPDTWQRKLRTMRAGGLNAVTT